MNLSLRSALLVLCLVLILPALSAEEPGGDKTLEKALANLDSTNWYIAANALATLKDQKNEKVDQAIEKALQSQYPYLQMTACSVAVKREDAKAVEKMAQMAIESSWRAVVDCAAAGVAKLAPDKGFDMIVAKWNGRPGRFAINLSRCLRFFPGEASSKTIQSIIKANADERATAYALEAARVHGLKDIEKMVTALKPKSAFLQYSIYEYMAICGDSKVAMGMLTKVLSSERDASLAMRAGKSLANFDAADINALIGIAAKKTNPGASSGALSAIADRPSYKDPRSVLKLFDGKTDSERIAAALAYEKAPSDALYEAVRKLAKGKDDLYVRYAAIRALSIQPDAKGTKDTISELLNSTDPDDELVGLMGAALVREKEFLPFIERILLSEPSPLVSAACGQAFTAIDPVQGLKICSVLLEKNKAKLSESVIGALSNMPFDKSAEMLVNILGAQDKSIRAKAHAGLMMISGNNFAPRVDDWKLWYEEATKQLKVWTPKHFEIKNEADDKSPVPVRGWLMPDAERFKIKDGRFSKVAALRPDMLSEQIVESGLLWLANFQDGDGKWSAKDYKIHASNPNEVASGVGEEWDQAVTALAILAFLDAGYSPVEGPYSRVIERGLNYLAAYVGVDGSLPIKSPRIEGEIFEHALVAQALVHGVIAGASEHRETASRALAFIMHQQTEKGGWGWTPNKMKNVCTPSTTYCAEAILKGMHAGFPIVPGVREGLANWFINEVSESVDVFQTIRDEKTSQEDYDKTITAKSSGGWEDRAFFASNTAMAATVYQMLGYNRDNPHIIAKLNLLIDKKAEDWNTPGSNNQGYPHHYHLYLTRAKALRGGKEFETWFKALATFLDTKMDKNGDAYGSWKPEGFDGSLGGRILSTAMSVMSLTTPYSSSSADWGARLYKVETE